jgi:enoyl-CoA hydratase/carnithine racemase
MIVTIEELPDDVSWLLRQGEPVIAYGGEHENADVCVETLREAQGISRHCATRPHAARILVQLLRAVEHLPIESALDMESLAYSQLQSGPEFAQWLAKQGAPTAVTGEGDAVLLERHGAQVRAILNRPELRNSITMEMRDALIEALQLLALDDSIQTFHLSAKGDCFSTGGELREFGLMENPSEAHVIRSLHNPSRLMAAHSQRISCHIHRMAIGSGIEIPAFASHLSADKRTRIQLPELKMGLIPGAGGCVSVTRRIGRQRTAWLVLSGKAINAPIALEWGLIDEIT